MVNNETMLQLERQAALILTPPDRAELAGQMNAVLSSLDVLQTCPDHAPIERDVTCPLRADEVRPSTDRTAALSGAPETDGTFFLVPRTVE